MSENEQLELSHLKTQEKLIEHKKSRFSRLYEKWPGKNMFFLKGFIITGPYQDIPRFILLIFGVFLSESPNLLLLFPYLWQCVHPCVPLFSLIFCIFTLILIFLCSFTDPGIIPRKKVFEITKTAIPLLYNRETILETLKKKYRNVYNDEERNYVYITTETSHDILIFKFCPTCEIFRPPKASHCKFCDNCIEVFDHHCPYLWNCIGKRNYKYYFAFLVSFNIFEIFNISGLGVYFYNAFFETRNYCLSQYNISFSFQIYVVLIACLNLVLFVILAYFLIFHLRLLWNGSTTKDYYTNLQFSSSKGFFQSRNWCSSDPTLFSPKQSIYEDII